MSRPLCTSILLCLILVFCGGVPSWAQPYFERSQVIQNPVPPDSGYAGDVDVDGEWMVVAAGGDNAAYVYRKTGTTWTQFTRLTCPVASCSRQSPDRGFGGSVAVDGTTMVVSIDANLGSPAWLGRLYIFNWTGSAWVFETELSPPAGYNLGGGLDLDGDYLLTSGADNNVQSNAGWTTFVFTRSGSSWIRSELTVPGRSTSADDLFGLSVGISGDTACVGAPGPSSNPGAVYMFRRTGSTWALEGSALVPVNTAGARIGSNCSVDGNTVAIGVERLIVGGQGNTGRTYIYQRTGSTWTLAQTLVPNTANAVFGKSVALAGNGLVVGATGDYLHPPQAVFFARENGTWVERLRSDSPIPSTTGNTVRFGETAAADGATFVVGAYNWTSSTPGLVATYVPSLTPPVSGPPGAPQSVQASVTGNNLSLTWAAPGIGAPVTNYTLLARLAAGGPVVATLPVGAVTNFGIAAPNGTFIISLSATNAFGTGPESAAVTVTLPAAAPPPGPPVGLVVSSVGSTAAFTWNAPTSGGTPTGYTLLAGLTPGFTTPFAALPLPASPRFFSVPGVPPGVYYVRLVATNAGGASGPSNEVTLTVVAPAVPAAPMLNAPVVSGRTVTFSWTPGAGGGAPTSYLLMAAVTPGGPAIASVPVSGTGLSVPGVPPGTYYVRVSGVNSVGAGPASNAVTVVVP